MLYSLLVGSNVRLAFPRRRDYLFFTWNGVPLLRPYSCFPLHHFQEELARKVENVTIEAGRPSPRSVAREADIEVLEEEVSTVRGCVYRCQRIHRTAVAPRGVVDIYCTRRV